MPAKRTTASGYQRAHALRKEPTLSEVRLWAYLRRKNIRGVAFRRQHAIGTYITDFCAPRRKLIIEVDGGQHIEQEEYDASRTTTLVSKGYRVLRFWNGDVLNDINTVMGVILEELEKSGSQD